MKRIILSLATCAIAAFSATVRDLTSGAAVPREQPMNDESVMP